MTRLASCSLIWALVAVLTGCGGRASQPAAPSSTPGARQPQAISTCGAAHGRWRTLRGVRVVAAALGSGPTVVFANDSSNDVCPWIVLAERLAADDYRVAVFTYSEISAADEPRALRETLAVAAAARAGSRFALVGASVGGRIVIEAAARRPPGLAAIVSLSGERTVQDYRDILPVARRVRAPALYIGAREDTYTNGARQQRELHDAMRGRPNEILQRSGFAHGTELIDVAAEDKLPAARLIEFLERQLGQRPTR